MSFYAESDFDPDQPISDAEALDARRDAVLSEYQAAREALKDVPYMDRHAAWAVQERFYRAYAAVLAEQDCDRHMAPANQQLLRDVLGVA